MDREKDSALEDFEKVRALDPHYAEAYYYLTELYLEKYEYEKADLSYSKCEYFGQKLYIKFGEEELDKLKKMKTEIDKNVSETKIDGAINIV